MKKVFITLGVLLFVFISTWGVLEIANADDYNYVGYIIDITENENGETVLFTLSGDTQSEFVVKWYTKKSAPRKQPFGIGDRVMLSTTHFSDINVKKIKVGPGYSTEGKLFYAEGLNSPFLLAVGEIGPYLVNVIHRDDILESIEAGDLVKFYHQTPNRIGIQSFTPESMKIVKKGSLEAFTDEEIAFIESQGYQMRKH